jgi:GTP-binding protein
VYKAYKASQKELPTPLLTRLLEDAILKHQPPLVGGRRIKLRYAHAGGHNPPVIVIHGNQARLLPVSYQRYLQNYYREKLNLVGTPILLELREGKNPYAKKA